MALQSVEFGINLSNQAQANFEAQVKKVMTEIVRDARALSIPVELKDFDFTMKGLEKLSQKIREFNSSLSVHFDTKTGFVKDYLLAASNTMGGISTHSGAFNASTGDFLGRSATANTAKAKLFNKEIDNAYADIERYSKKLIEMQTQQNAGLKDYSEEIKTTQILLDGAIQRKEKLLDTTAARYKTLNRDSSGMLVSTNARTASYAAQHWHKESELSTNLEVYRKEQTAKINNELARQDAKRAKDQAAYLSALAQQYQTEEQIHNLEVQNNPQNQLELEKLQEKLFHQKISTEEAKQKLANTRATVAEEEKLAALEAQHSANIKAIDTKQQNKDLQTRNQLENNYLDALQRQYKAEIELERMKTDPKHRYGSEALDSQQKLVDVLRNQTSEAAKQINTNEMTAEATAKKARMEEAYHSEILKANGSLVQQQGFLKSFIQNFRNTFKQVVTAGLSWKIWAAGVQTLRNAVQTVTKIDTAMVELKKVTDETDEAYSKFLKNAKTAAVELGATIDELVNSTAGFARLGYSLSEATQLAEIATVYTRVGDEVENVEQATSVLVSTMKAFGIEAKDAMRIIDTFNEVGNNFAVTSGGIGEALERSASSLMTAGNTLEESVGLIVAIDEIIQDSAKTGQALKTISMRLRNTAGQLEELDEDAEGAAESITKLQTQILNATKGQVNIMRDNDTFKTTTQILTELSQVWNDLTDVQRADLTRLIAGRQQGNAFNAVMTNMSKGIEATTVALNSQGSAMREHEKWLNSIQGATYQFEASLQSLYSNLIDSEVIKFLIHSATGLIQIVDALHLLPVALNAIIAIGIPKLVSSLSKNIEGNTKQWYQNAKATSVAEMNLMGVNAQQATDLLLSKGLFDNKASLLLVNNEENQTLLKQQLIMAGASEATATEIVQKLTEEQLRRKNAQAVRNETQATNENTVALELNANTTNLLAIGWNKLKTALKGLFTSFSGWMTIISLVATGISLLKQYTNWFDSAKQKQEALHEALKKSTDELKQQEQTVKDISDKIVDLTKEYEKLNRAQSSLTDAEKIRLANVNAELAGLRAQLQVEESIKALKEEEVKSSRQKTLESDAKAINEYQEAATKYYDTYVKISGKTSGILTEDTVNEYALRNYALSKYGVDKYLDISKEVADYFEFIDPFNTEATDDMLVNVSAEAASIIKEIVSAATAQKEWKTVQKKYGKDFWSAELEALNEVYTSTTDEAQRNAAEVQIKKIYKNFLSSELYNEYDKWIQGFVGSASDQTKLYTALVGMDKAQIKQYLSENFTFMEEAAGYNYDEYIDTLIEKSGQLKTELQGSLGLTEEELAKHFDTLSKAMQALSAVEKTFRDTNTYSREEIEKLRTTLGLTENQVSRLVAVINAKDRKKITQELKTLAAQYVVNTYNLKTLNEQTKQKIKTDLQYLGITGEMDKLYDLLNQRTELQIKMNKILLTQGHLARMELTDLQQKINSINQQIEEFLDTSIDLSGIGSMSLDYQDELEKIEKQYSNHEITAKEYYAKLVQLRKKYLGELKSDVSEEKSLDEKIEKALKSSVEEQVESWEKVISYTQYIYEQRKKLLEKEKEKLEEKNDEQERSINLEKAEQRLKSARTQKTMRVYYEGVGWVWETDKEELAEAQQAYDQLLNEDEVAKIDTQIQGIDDIIDELTSRYENLAEMFSTRSMVDMILGSDGLAKLEAGTMSLQELFNTLDENYVPALVAAEALENPSMYSALSKQGSGVLPSSIIDWMNTIIKDPTKFFNTANLSSLIGSQNTTINIQSIMLPNVTNGEEFANQLQLIAQNH